MRPGHLDLSDYLLEPVKILIKTTFLGKRAIPKGKKGCRCNWCQHDIYVDGQLCFSWLGRASAEQAPSYHAELERQYSDPRVQTAIAKWL